MGRSVRLDVTPGRRQSGVTGRPAEVAYLSGEGAERRRKPRLILSDSAFLDTIRSYDAAGQVYADRSDAIDLRALNQRTEDSWSGYLCRAAEACGAEDEGESGCVATFVCFRSKASASAEYGHAHR
jgi:hypothetical protein